MTKTRLFLVFSLNLCFIIMNAQDRNAPEMLEYEKGFEFNKGVYLTFEDFKFNQPGIQDGYLFKDGKIYLKDDSIGKMVLINVNHWGYTDGKSIFIRTVGDFNYENGSCRNCSYARIGIIGELSHLVISMPSANGSGGGVAMGAGGVGFGVSVPIGGSSSSGYQQYLLDFKSGSFIQFNRKTFESILEKRDPALYEEYKRTKMKKSAKPNYFLTLYNRSHQIYFPEY